MSTTARTRALRDAVMLPTSDERIAALRALKCTREEHAALVRWIQRGLNRDGQAIMDRTTRFGVNVALRFMAGEVREAQWQTDCEHGYCVGHETRKVAESFLSHPYNYCPWCKDIVDGVVTVEDARTRVDAGETR